MAIFNEKDPQQERITQPQSQSSFRTSDARAEQLYYAKRRQAHGTKRQPITLKNHVPPRGRMAPSGSSDGFTTWAHPGLSRSLCSDQRPDGSSWRPSGSSALPYSAARSASIAAAFSHRVRVVCRGVLDCLESGLCLLCVEKSPRMELFCPSNDTRLLGPLTGNYSIGYVRTYSPFLSSQLLSLVMILKSGFILILGVRYRCGLGSGNNFVIEVTTNAG
ncbi:hypothetical protein M514_23841 [Trichuris suis]|uniref:Uncharacterized protein n=1 Tax=Trichuris suis TaxID=68888 RepID=A0A085N3E7_9BILA|nr:hypothetical protein M514_23841 [Trichuris suis]